MIKKASKNMKGFDTCTPLSLEKAKEFKNAGYDFCIRYVSLSNNRTGDITTKEANNIINAGLALGIVQHVRYPGWKPSASLGQSDAQMALNHLAQVGIPKGITVYVDLEGVASGTSASDIIAYANTWHDVIEQAGYIPGIYVGANSYLTGSQLYNSLKFQHYWKSLSIVPNVVVRGYEMVQLRQINQLGVLIDEDVVYGDNLGNTPIFIFPNMQEEVIPVVGPFQDVPENHWAAQVILDMYNRGLLSKSTAFRPDQPITRAEAVALIDRVLKYLGK
ncbi:DUF1906 domain-containing protein [Thermoanaerobacterium sp. CMT5567-10]|uniref:glycoside hydrolase domain-containing protein n=1 Tax=Thermoanaerobacterium sp. CMT5567-10 TaxID=3061989 RepID=UPI0026DECAF1|nr:glycoside hydrolase domain-containing protein [Thermoanaerobacterium sp. CMT5567-10]WKV08213.1 DUF1906 domain-containing protein [Thermoanaerobacterium sp. CMT5567-10]